MQCAIPGNFAVIAKISLGLRKFRFRNHSENFAILVKFQASEISLYSENHCA